MVNHFHDLLYLLRRKELRYAALGDAWFWGVGGFFYLVLVKISGEVVAGKVGVGTLYGFWFLLLGIGIMLGSIFVAYLNRGRIEIGLSAIGSIGMPIVFMGFCVSEPLSGLFSGLCLSLGFFGALFFVPLNGYIQDRADQNERGRVLAASNLLTQLVGILMILLHAYLSNIVGLLERRSCWLFLYLRWSLDCLLFQSIRGFFSGRGFICCFVFFTDFRFLGWRIFQRKAGACLSVIISPTPILFLLGQPFLERFATWLTQDWHSPSFYDLFFD